MRRFFALSTFAVAMLFAGGVSSAGKKPPPAPKLPPPSVELRVEPRPQHAWVMMVTNTGDVPIKIVADARLLRFEIEPPREEDPEEATPPPKGKKAAKKKKPDKPLECALPASMRSDARTLVLAPKSRYLEVFDPRLYCLDGAKKIVAGAKVTAKFGWAPGKAKTPAAPFVATAATPDSSKEIGPAKEIVAGAFVVTEKSSLVPVAAPIFPTTTTTNTSATPTIKPLVAHSGTAHSALRGKDATITIHLVNASTETQIVYARPQIVDARVKSPRGVITVCDGWAHPAPIVDFVVRLKPEAKWSATVSLASICPDGTFDVPGLYEIIPRMHADPISWEPKAVTGDIIADTPQLLRIEEGGKPFYDFPPSTLTTSE
jgi:hypothetical protein